jgi:hypothetical protein
MQEQIQRHHSGRLTVHTLGNFGCYAPKSMSKVRATCCAPSACAPITHLVSKLSHVQTWRLSQTPSHLLTSLTLLWFMGKWQIHSSGGSGNGLSIHDWSLGCDMQARHRIHATNHLTTTYSSTAVRAKMTIIVVWRGIVVEGERH